MGTLDLGVQLAHLDATAQAALVRSGDVSAVELVQAAVDAAQRVNPILNAIIHPRYEAALAEAASPGTGPFAGVPMVMKDLSAAMAGEPFHQGSRALKAIDHRGDRDSAVYRRFREAGFVTIGRTNVPEWGSTITTEPLAYGPTRNPWNIGHSTGGSSGGSAAAVAAGVVAVAHASDGGGSIRIPASECGLVGLKPSRGRVSPGPDAWEAWDGYSTSGAITRSVRDTAAVLDAISGYEPGDPYVAPAWPRPLVQEVGADPGSLRVGFVDRSPHAPSHPEVEAALAEAAMLLSSLGHAVEQSAPAAMFDPSMNPRFLIVIAAHTRVEADWVESLLGRPIEEGDLEFDNRALAAMGASISAADYLRAQAAQGLWTRDMLSWWHPADGSRGFDVLMTPTIAGPPPPIGWLSGRGSAARMRALLQFTGQFNVTGQPAISLPTHVTADGLPVGVQLVAAYGREDLLVRLASQIERARPWASPPAL